jgi:hypothetical protein
MTKYTLQEFDNALSKILGSKKDEKSSLGYNIKRNFVMQSGHMLLLQLHLGYNGLDKTLRQGMHTEFWYGRLLENIQLDDRGDIEI